MKVLVQDTLATPGDWRLTDSADWAGLAKKPEPAGGEVIDDTPGWVYQVNVQGVTFSADYIAVIDRPDGGCEVIAADVDPEDYQPPDMYVQHWTFLPLAPDVKLGGALNTRQSRVVYAGSRAKAKFEGTENTVVKPLGQFVRPAEGLIRYGIWLSDVLSDAHVAARSIRGWRDWGDHLDPSELDENGRVKVQRDLGWWDKAKGTITYFQRDTDRAVGWVIADHEDAFETSTATAASESVTFNNELGRHVWGFTTPTNEPNSADWPNGTYRFQYDVTAIGGVQTITATLFVRLNSAADSILESQQDDTDITGTGLHLRSVTLDWAAGAAGDRFGVRVVVDHVSHMQQTVTLELNTSDSFADGPWTAGALSGSGALTLGPIAIAGTGTMQPSGSGALALGPPAIAGTGVEKFIGSGVLLLGVPAISGTGATEAEGSGALTLGVPAIAGTGEEKFTATGALVLGAPAIAGTGVEVFTATGALALNRIAIAGTGVAGADGTGALALGPPLIAGSAVEEFIASGALALTPTPIAISGTGSHSDATDGTGALLLAVPSITGTGVMQPSGTGALVLGPPLIAGSGIEEFIASGALALSTVAIAGTGAEKFTATGALLLGAPAISGSAVEQFIASGGLTIARPSISGSGIERLIGQGALTLAVPGISGSAVEQMNAAGALLLPVPAISGVAVMIPDGAGALTIAGIVISATGVSVLVAGPGTAVLIVTGAEAVVVNAGAGTTLADGGGTVDPSDTP